MIVPFSDVINVMLDLSFMSGTIDEERKSASVLLTESSSVVFITSEDMFIWKQEIRLYRDL